MKRMLAAALILTLAVLALPWLFKLDQAASPPDVPENSRASARGQDPQHKASGG